ncbi:MAG: hypothetical protein ACKO3W_02465 [bacterium]
MNDAWLNDAWLTDAWWSYSGASRGPAEACSALGGLTLAREEALFGKVRNDLWARHHARVTGGIGERTDFEDDLAEEIGLQSGGRIGFTELLGHRYVIGIRSGRS